MQWRFRARGPQLSGHGGGTLALEVEQIHQAGIRSEVEILEIVLQDCSLTENFPEDFVTWEVL